MASRGTERLPGEDGVLHKYRQVARLICALTVLWWASMQVLVPESGADSERLRWFIAGGATTYLGLFILLLYRDPLTDGLLLLRGAMDIWLTLGLLVLHPPWLVLFPGVLIFAWLNWTFTHSMGYPRAARFAKWSTWLLGVLGVTLPAVLHPPVWGALIVGNGVVATLLTAVLPAEAHRQILLRAAQQRLRALQLGHRQLDHDLRNALALIMLGGTRPSPMTETARRLEARLPLPRFPGSSGCWTGWRSWT